MNASRYFFLHIPKTAGTSLHQLLHQEVGPYWHLRYPHEIQSPATLIWDRFRGCGGHTNWALAGKFGFLKGFTFTFLRDPGKRTLSQFVFSRLAGHGSRIEAQFARGKSLANLLRESSGNFGAFWNVQTRVLSSLGSDERFPEKHLESALLNLEKLHFVGTTETFTDDARDLVRLLGGGSAHPYVPRENQSPSQEPRPVVDQELAELLESTQALDRVLYARAVELRSKRNPTIMRSSGEVTPLGWPISLSTHNYGNVRVTQIEVRSIEHPVVTAGTDTEIAIKLDSPRPVKEALLEIQIEDVMGNYTAGINSITLPGKSLDIPAGSIRCSFQFIATMGAGSYALHFKLSSGTDSLCEVRFACTFEVIVPASRYREGLVDIDATFHSGLDLGNGPIPEKAAREMYLAIELSPFANAGQGALKIPVQFFNKSNCVLSDQTRESLFASYHWHGPEGVEGIFEGVRTPLPKAAWPEESLVFDVNVLPPPTIGTWVLEIRLVQEGVRWHEGPGFEAVLPQDIHLFYDGEKLSPTTPVRDKPISLL